MPILDQAWLNGALVWAADGELDSVKELIAMGADVNGIPLIMAIQCDCLDIVEELIAAGALVNQTYEDTTPLIRAVESRYPYIVEALIKHGADVNQIAPKGVTPLQAALTGGRTNSTPDEDQEIIRLLKQAGAQ